MSTVLNSADTVPTPVLTSILQEHLRDPGAQLTQVNVSPFSNSGVSGNNSFYRADINWTTSDPLVPTGSSSWLIKSWSPGGLSLAELNWSQPIEALAWQQGILHPEALPVGVKTPIIGSVVDPGGKAAWVAMVDVAPDLRVYDRSIPLPSDRLISHVKTILSALARFHALWEQPEQQERIERMNWLLPFENYVWRKSSFYATILGEAVVGGFSQVTPVEQDDIKNLQAFASWLEPSTWSALKALLVDRRMLVSRFSGVPSTLTHGDLDDRNIGLSWDSNAEGELVLIDWERLGRGPAAMDVAKLLILMPMLCEPGKPYPEVYWSGELPDFYYESYHQAGGKKMDIATWRRSYDLALITETLWPFPWALGNLMRTFRGEIPLSEIPGLPEAEARIQQASNLENLNHTVELVMGAINRVMN